jgi:hypothetical protein
VQLNLTLIQNDTSDFHPVLLSLNNIATCAFGPTYEACRPEVEKQMCRSVTDFTRLCVFQCIVLGILQQKVWHFLNSYILQQGCANFSDQLLEIRNTSACERHMFSQYMTHDVL